ARRGRTRADGGAVRRNRRLDRAAAVLAGDAGATARVRPAGDAATLLRGSGSRCRQAAPGTLVAMWWILLILAVVAVAFYYRVPLLAKLNATATTARIRRIHHMATSVPGGFF